MFGHGRVLRVSEGVYRVLLRAYPKEFRDVYGSQMVQMFRDLCREEVGRAGTSGLVVLCMRLVLDLLSTASVERSNMLAGRGFVIPFASSPKLVRWGGIVGVVGGVLGLAHSLLFVLHFAYPSASSVLLRPTVLNLLGPFVGLLIVVGLVGLCALATRYSGRMAPLDVLLAYLSTVLIGLSTSQILVILIFSGNKLGLSEEGPHPVLVGSVGLIGLLGFLLLGVVAYRARVLGRWSILPLALGILIPLLSTLIPFLLSVLSGSGSEPVMIRIVEVGSAIRLQLPEVLLHLGWILLGYLLWSRGRSYGNYGEDEAQRGAVAG